MKRDKMIKRICLLIFALVMMAASAKAGNVPYAVYNDGTLTFKYGEKPSGAYVYDINNGYYVPAWTTIAGLVTTVVFEPSFKQARPTSCHYWFANMGKLTTIEGLSYLTTFDVTDMAGMFYGCYSLKTIVMSYFNTSNVKDMSLMFFMCTHLESIFLLGNFDTSNVTDMRSMFDYCSSLTSLNLHNFNTSQVTNMNSMFSHCSALTSLDVSNFNTSQVTNMNSMFSHCSALTSLDVSGFNTSNVKDMSGMFKECSGLTSLDLSKFNTSNVKDMSGMFKECSGLTSLDLSGFKTFSVTDMTNMFKSCSSLTTIYCHTAWSCEKSDSMFNGCSNLKGAISYESSKINATYANPETGYFTYKTYPLLISGGIVTGKNSEDLSVLDGVTGTVRFDYLTNTLYMKDAVIDTGNSNVYGIVSTVNGLSIIAEGDCLVKSSLSTALYSHNGSLTIGGTGTLTLQGVTGLVVTTSDDNAENDICLTDNVTLIVEGTNGNGIVGGVSNGTYYTTLSMQSPGAVLKVKGSNYDLFRIKDVNFISGQHVAMPTEAYFSTTYHTLMSNGSALKNTWVEFSTKIYAIYLTNYTWPSDFEAADYEASTSTTGCKVTNIVYSMFSKSLDLSDPSDVNSGDNIGICFTVELDEGYTFASNVTAYIERDGVTLPQEYKLLGSTDSEKRFAWVYTVPTPEGGSYVRTVTEKVTAPVAGAEPVWTSENSATATAAGAKPTDILPEPTAKEVFARAGHTVNSIEWVEINTNSVRKMQQGETFQPGKKYGV